MDGIKSRQPARPIHRRPHSAGAAARPHPVNPVVSKTRHQDKTYWLVRSLGKTAATKRKKYQKFLNAHFFYLLKRDRRYRAYVLMVLLLFLVSIAAVTVQPFLDTQPYKLNGPARALLPKQNQNLAKLLQFNAQEQKFVYNKGYTGQISPDSAASSTGSARITAEFGKTALGGAVVTDPVNNLSFSLKPKFSLLSGKQDQNQLLYPLGGFDGYLVYTAQVTGVKEDIILANYTKNDLSFEYELGLPAGLEPRLEQDGSIGVYGADSPILGNVAASSEQDQQLLEKARTNASKTKLIFMIPAPVIVEGDRKVSAAKAVFQLEGKTLRILTRDLDKANYPISIDPSVYVETAQKLMRGNNETNTDFDVDNELIQKSQTTGARIDEWSSTSNLSNPVWGQGTAVAGGFIYTVGGGEGSSTITSTYYSAGNHSYNVPTGVTSLTIKTWGAGGGGGAGANSSGVGGDGGGGGYAKSVITVTPGETLDIVVGSGGAKAGGTRQGGSGGGFSAVLRAAAYLLQAGGGGGGGGAEGTSVGDGGDGGAGGGVNGVNGVVGESTGGGGGARGTNIAGGAGGSAGTGGTAGAAGVANAGGDAGASNGVCNTSIAGNSGGAGGFGGGGLGGNDTSSCEGGGGGGGGRFGGGGGGSVNSNNRGAGGGGGGSSQVTGSSTVETAGSGTAPGNSGDSDRNNAGQGGVGGASTAAAANGADGGVVVSYTLTGPAVTSSVAWAKFNSTTSAIESPNPGNGACAGWCTNSAYDLPVALRGLSLVAYNGFLYAIGGSNISGAPQTSVYIAKIGANGEPQLWHPSGGTPAYWYSDTALSAARSYFGAVAYNNRLYILGGLTTSSTVLSTNTVQFADIKPMGTLSAWTATGMSALSSNRYGLTAHVYNDTMYVIGGNTALAGTPITTVQYAKLNTDGTMNSWVTTNSLLTSGRQTMGGSFSTIWGGYVYISGGCTAVNASGYCTAIASDVQLASINADGSLAEWNTILGLTSSQVGHTMIAWQGALYKLGGCRSQDATSGDCTNTILDVDYGVINPDGEASTVATSVASGVAPCSGGAPYSCNMPASIGNVLNSAAVLNGYLYIMGGCTNNACTTVSTGVTYQAIATDGSLQRPATCTGSYTDSYCVSSTSLPVGIGAGATAIFNGRIYIVGGFNSDTNIYYTAVNSDGSIGAFSNADLTTIGAADVNYAFAYARANPSAAGSVPGHLFIFGGCMDSSVGCSTYSQGVYKCNISTAGAPSGCTTTGQLQIGTIPGASSAGLGAMAGAVYANYIYLMGGLAPGVTDLPTTRYAKFDNNNNVVTVGTGWVEGPNALTTGRRRGAGFGYNGFLYVVGGYDGTTGVLADIEYAKLNVSDGSWETWETSSVTINQRWGLTVPISNSYAYVIGGCTAGAAPGSCSTRTNTIQTFQIYNNNSGAVSNFTAQSDQTFTANTDRLGASAAIYNGYLYVAGGCVSATDCTDAVDSVQYAPISTTDGSIGTWAAGGNLPAQRAWGALEVVGGTLYYIGGQDDTAANEQSTIYYTTGISSGNPTWSGTATTQALPDARTKFGSVVWNNRIYVVGGLTSGSAVSATVYVSPQLVSGGNITFAWTTTTSFNVARSGVAVTAYANNLYLFGGNDGTNFLGDSQYTQINSDGTLDAWTYGTSLPTALSDSRAVSANGYVYLVGGRSAASTCIPKTLITPISANTTIASGNNPTGVGEWYETNVKYTGDRYGAAVAYDKGKLYTMGGGCAAPLTTNRHYYSTVKSQPQVAIYSRMIDTDTDVFPNAWLMNGLDNSIGARWQVKYRSMNDTDGIPADCGSADMSTWGQETNYGSVTLGDVAPYVPRDGSGTNINCARYFYFSVSIDASKTFGYPEDVTRGPTIADITLFYTSDPSKRLLHGKTFTGGEQQPLDTPCRQTVDADCPLP